MSEHHNRLYDADDPFHWMPQRFLRQHAKRVQHRKRLKRLFGMVCALLLLYGFVLSQGGLLPILRAKYELHQLQKNVAAMRSQKQILQKQIQLRSEDPDTLERMAREEYGMILPGEKVFRILEADEAKAQHIEQQQQAHRAIQRRIPRTSDNPRTR